MQSETQLANAKELYRLPLFDLILKSHQIHRENHNTQDIQRCALLSIKTGGCPEDCGYCPQSAHHPGQDTQRHPLLSVEDVRRAAKSAKASGAERFCMGAAWREVKSGPEFDRVLKMVRAVKQEQLEACVTLGMLTFLQAVQLKEAGLDAYNHNLDTSEEFYSEIISTRKFEDRLRLITRLSCLTPQPESVPINLLIPVPGTPLGDRISAERPLVDSMDLVRLIAVARILMPRTRIRLSAGRIHLSREAQLWAFFAGANSIFFGEKLLTRENPELQQDEELLALLKPKSKP